MENDELRQRTLLSVTVIFLTLLVLAAPTSGIAQEAEPEKVIYNSETGIPDNLMASVFIPNRVGHGFTEISHQDHIHAVRQIKREVGMESYESAEAFFEFLVPFPGELYEAKHKFMRDEVCPLDVPRPTGAFVYDRLNAYDEISDVYGAMFLDRIQSYLSPEEFENFMVWMEDAKQGTIIGRTNHHVAYADRDPDMVRQRICGRFDSAVTETG